MSMHRAPGRRWCPVVAVVCLAAAVLGLVAWRLPGPGPPTIHSGRSVEAAPEHAALAPAPTPTMPPPPSAASSRTAPPSRPAPPPPAAGGGPGAGQTRRFEVTLYGARDNDPAGSTAIAYPT